MFVTLVLRDTNGDKSLPSHELWATGDSVVAGLVPATSRDISHDASREISVKDYTESHADLADAWGQCHTKGWWPAPGRPLHCHQ